MLKLKSTSQSGLTLIEVMMASLILVVGFTGMIQAVTVTSSMMNAARRQTLATQILTHEIEKLRFLPCHDPLNPADIFGLSAGNTVIPIDTQFKPVWSSTAAYGVDANVCRNGIWYRCLVAHTNQAPPNPDYWAAATSLSVGLIDDKDVACGATYTLSRSVAHVVPGSLREVTFTVTWVVKTSRRDAGGALVIFTYTRSNSAYFGKNGLNLTYQRS